MIVHATDTVCARCAAPLEPDGSVACPECHGMRPRTPFLPVDVSPERLGAVPASAARRVAAVLCDVGVVALLATGVGVLAWVLGSSALIAFVVAAVALVLCAAVVAVVWVSIAWTPGGTLTRTVSVRADDGTPLGRSALGRALRGRPIGSAVALGSSQGALARALGVVTVDLRRGADPRGLLLPSIDELPAPRQSIGVDGGRSRPGAVTLVYEQRTRIGLDRAVVLGRTPRVEPPEPGVVAVALPDLSRRLSRNHVRVDLDRGRVFATDLGSLNGTELAVGSRVERLRTGQRTEIPEGAHLLLDGRPLRVHTRSGHVRAS